MDAVLRALAVYAVLLVVFRAAGKRSVAEITTFDFILLLIISEAVQEALIDGDGSMTNAFVLVITLVGVDILISVLKQRWRWFDRLVDGSPLVVMADGQLLRQRMKKARVDEADILSAARAATDWSGSTRSSTRCWNATAASRSCRSSRDLAQAPPLRTRCRRPS